MKPPAREHLDIFWQGEQASGLTFHGLCARGTWGNAEFPTHLWPPDVASAEFMLHNEVWEAPSWDVLITQWPTSDEWQVIVRATLTVILEGGAVVAWIGSEGMFCDPPALFDPQCMSGGVFAALTQAGDFFCPLDPHGPLVALTNEELLHLRQASQGLSDAG